MENKIKDVPYISHEGEIASLERIISRLHKIIIALIIALPLCVGAVHFGWLHFLNNFDIITEDTSVDIQSEKGNANYAESDGEIINY